MKLLISFTLLLFSFAGMGQKFHTDFEYSDVINNSIRIQNSYPKGGQKYTDPSGRDYVYVVFWTRITNETASELEITINFPRDSFTVPSSPDVNFNLYLPKDKMTLEKESLYNYGLDVKSFLDKNIGKLPELLTTISPHDSYLFYVVAISNQGVDGVVRAGFELQKQELVYTINGHKINCGKTAAKD